MSNIDKNWALNQLRHNRNSLFLAFSVLQIIRSEDVKSIQNRVVVIKSDGGVIFNSDPADRVGARFEIELSKVVREFYENKSDFDYTLKSFMKGARRALVKESFEVVQAYAKENSLTQVLKSQDWFQFARMVRNCISHDMHFRFNGHDKSLLPAAWGGKTIFIEMDNHEMPEDIIDPYTALALFWEMEKFVCEN